MIFKKIFFTFTAFAAFTFANEWSLEDCLKQVQKSSLKLQAAKLKEQKAEISVKQAKSASYPTVNASIQNTLFDHPFIDNEDHYRLNLGISGSYTLWDGGSKSLNVESSELSKTAASFATKQTLRTLQENVINAYMSLLAATENFKVATSAVKLSKVEYENYKILFEAGSITKKDLTQSEANVLQKQVAALSAELNVNTATTTLKQLLEITEEDFKIQSLSINFESADSLPSISTLKQISENSKLNNPGLKADSVTLMASKKNTQAVSKDNSITVTLGANSSTGLQAWQSNAYKEQLKKGWQNSITLGINIPLIDGGVTNNKILQAQVSETENQVALQENLKVLDNTLEKLYINALNADLQWKAASMQVQAETEALTVAEEQRNAGALTYTDFLTQKNNLEKANITLVNAKYTSILARKLLELYQGELD